MKDNGGTLPVIIYSKKNIKQIRSCVLENYGTIKYELPFINALCVEVPIEKLESIKCNKNISLITTDAEVSKLPVSPNIEAELPHLSVASPDIAEAMLMAEPVNKTFFKAKSIGQVRTRSLQKSVFSLPLQGEGVTIAIIDTGISPHYDLVKPFNRILAFKDFVNNGLIPYDDDGHGTHVAGLAAGNGYLFGGYDVVDAVRTMFPDKANSLICMGAAPKSQIVALKALDGQGNGNTSDILAAMQWVSENYRKYNIRVLNLSLGIDATSYDIDGDGRNEMVDPLVLAVNTLVRLGISIVVAAGNSGPSPGSITSPGTSPLVITVGSIDGKGQIPDFSSRGPTAAGATKPDLVAPGMEVLSLAAGTNKQYIRQSGTSMSAPAVAGAAACIHAINPRLSPAQVKTYLMQNAIFQPSIDRNSQGAGLLNLT